MGTQLAGAAFGRWQTAGGKHILYMTYTAAPDFLRIGFSAQSNRLHADADGVKVRVVAGLCTHTAGVRPGTGGCTGSTMGVPPCRRKVVADDEAV